jgi:hypothetical protein
MDYSAVAFNTSDIVEALLHSRIYGSGDVIAYLTTDNMVVFSFSIGRHECSAVLSPLSFTNKKDPDEL